MASTYSTNLRLELIGTGEQQGSWGATTNKNLGTLLEQAICGYESVTVSDSVDTVLTAADGIADQSRNVILNFIGAITAARNVICPAIEKLYVVKNATTGGFPITFKVSGQTGVSVPNGATVFLYVDGTDVRTITASAASRDIGTSGATVPLLNGTNTWSGSQAFSNTNYFNAPQVIETSNTFPALRITQTGAGNALVVEDSANPDATPFVVDASGGVGIGQNPVSNRKLTIANDRASIPYGAVLSTYNNGAFENDIITGFDGTSGFVGNFQDYRFDILTNALPRVTVSNSGNVGIGTTSPAAPLEIASAGIRVNTSRSISSNVNDGVLTLFGGTSGDGANIELCGSAYGLPSAALIDADGHFFRSANAASEYIRISTSGALGFSGANYGTSGQFLRTNGSGGTPSWESLGSVALLNTVPIANGGTGATTNTAARTNLGLAIGTNVQAYDATLQSISALGTAADRYAYTTGVNTWAEGTITAAGRAILDDADAAAQRTTLGLTIGTNVQAYDATLQSISALGTTANRYAYTTALNTWAEGTITAAGRAILDDADAAAQRTTLGLGTSATLDAGTAANNVVQLDGTAKLPAVDGSQLTNLPVQSSSGRLLRAPRILTSGTSYTTPAGCNSIYVELVGGGGGGAGGNISASGGGGGGAYAAKYFTVTALTAYTYAIGPGGTANSGAGGDTTFTVGATTVTAGGGGGGGSSGSTPPTSASGGGGGTATNGDINVSGGSGNRGFAATSYATVFTGSGGASGLGFGAGGQSAFASSNATLNGSNASGYGGGGGGGQGNGTGGDGTSGVIRIWEYA